MKEGLRGLTKMADGDNGMSMETQISIAESSMFPGFRFSPTDEELISFYLKKKMEGSQNSVQIIPEIDLCRFEPWDLPAKSVLKSESEWFFFSSRGRKYPNGSQSRRATEVGYWKATGKERTVKSGSRVIGTKRTLVFHVGRAPKGERTEWIMHEYCMHGQSQDSLVVCRLKRNHEFRSTGTSNPDSLNQSTTTVRNSAVTGVGIDQMGLSEGDKGGGGGSKNCSSSYDSYSVEQIDSTSESKQKPSNEFYQAECSGRHKDDDGDDEDCYADILKNDIINLDESPILPARVLFMVPKKSEAGIRLKQPMQMSRMQPFQGTANRRIRLEVQEAAIPTGGAVSLEERVAPAGPKPRPELRSVYSVWMPCLWYICIASIVVTLVVAWVFLTSKPKHPQIPSVTS